jgi:hypothetical protein
MANPEHLAILNQRGEPWNKWWGEQRLAALDGFYARLDRARPRVPDLSGADLGGTKLSAVER